jgi:hypothetical protein
MPNKLQVCSAEIRSRIIAFIAREAAIAETKGELISELDMMELVRNTFPNVEGLTNKTINPMVEVARRQGAVFAPSNEQASDLQERLAQLELAIRDNSISEATRKHLFSRVAALEKLLKYERCPRCGGRRSTCDKLCRLADLIERLDEKCELIDNRVQVLKLNQAINEHTAELLGKQIARLSSGDWDPEWTWERDILLEGNGE